MKNKLKLLALFATVAIPGALALEFAGVNLPPSLDLGSAFVLFVLSQIALTVVSDYSRPNRKLRIATLGEAKASHPLAA